MDGCYNAENYKQLTNTEVKLDKPRDKEYNLADERLYLRIKSNGSKLRLFNYTRPTTKKRANLGLGNYPDLPLADAREKAQELRTALTKGLDPQEYRQEQQLKASEAYANTFQVVANRWLKLKQPEVSEAYYKKIDDRLNKYVFPKLGNIPIHKINWVSELPHQQEGVKSFRFNETQILKEGRKRLRSPLSRMLNTLPHLSKRHEFIFSSMLVHSSIFNYSLTIVWVEKVHERRNIDLKRGRRIPETG